MNIEIKNTLKELRSIYIAQVHYYELDLKLTQYRKRYYILRRDLEKKFDKIEKWDNNKLTPLIKNIFNKKKIELDIIRQKYLEMSIEMNDIHKSMSMIEYEMEILNRKIKAEGALKRKLKTLIHDTPYKTSTYQIRKYKKILVKYDKKKRIVEEIKEAIKEGSHINRKFNSAIKFIENIAAEFKDLNYSKSELINFKVKTIEGYQDKIIAINHSFIKYQSEIKDVYNEILDSSDYENKMIDTFMNDYRMSLTQDLISSEGLNESWKALKHYKAIIQNMNKLLRKDLKSIESDLVNLEIEEHEFYQELMSH